MHYRYLLMITTIVLLISLSLPTRVFADDITIGHYEFTTGNYDKAINSYMKAVRTAKDGNCDILYRIGLSYFMKGDSQDSLDYFTKAKSCNPNIFNGRIFRVPSGGMEPTLIIGDYVIADSEFYKIVPVKRFDVAVVADPSKKGNLLTKRIIGMPGETVEIRNNKVFIDGKPLVSDIYGSFKKPTFEKAGTEYGPAKVPQGQYFVLGDNRNMTFDSRHFGFVNNDGVISKVLIIYGSIDNSKEQPVRRDDRTGLLIK